MDLMGQVFLFKDSAQAQEDKTSRKQYDKSATSLKNSIFTAFLNVFCTFYKPNT
jgi:hypothetical protein